MVYTNLAFIFLYSLFLNVTFIFQFDNELDQINQDPYQVIQLNSFHRVFILIMFRLWWSSSASRIK